VGRNELQNAFFSFPPGLPTVAQIKDKSWIMRSFPAKSRGWDVIFAHGAFYRE
jgi:hypothetical protein